MLALHLDVGQALPGLRIGRLEQERQEIVRRRLAPGQQRLAGVDQLADHLLEEADAPAGRASRPIRGSQSGKPKMSSGSSGPSASK